MTQKELKRLNRRQLLELLLMQTERVEQLQKQLDEARAKLDEKSVAILESGSIAEASLKLSGIFEAADAAAASYLESIRQQAQRESEIEAEAARKAQAMLEETERKCREREQAADEYWEQTQVRIRENCKLLNDIFGNERG